MSIYTGELEKRSTDIEQRVMEMQETITMQLNEISREKKIRERVETEIQQLQEEIVIKKNELEVKYFQKIIRNWKRNMNLPIFIIHRCIYKLDELFKIIIKLLFSICLYPFAVFIQWPTFFWINSDNFLILFLLKNNVIIVIIIVDYSASCCKIMFHNTY